MRNPVSAIRNPGLTGFIVSITLSDGRVIERKTGTVDMQTQLKDLSTASMNTAEGQAQHQLENRILNALQFPLAGTATANYETSSYHDGDALYALDLSGGTGKELVAPATGKIFQVDLIAGQLVLEHQLSTGELWYTTFYHLSHILEKVTHEQYTGLQEALDTMDIDQKYKTIVDININSRKDIEKLPNIGLPLDVLAKVQAVIDAILVVQADLDKKIADWKTTDPKQFSSADGVLATMSNEGDADGKHLHMQVNVGSMKGKPVDQFKWLDNRMNGIATTTNIDNRTGSMDYIWNNGVNALVNASERIAMIRADRKNAAGKLEGYARTFAWEDGKNVENMVEVGWKSIGTWINPKTNKTEDYFLWMPSDSSLMIGMYWNNGIWSDLAAFKKSKGIQ